MPPVGQKQGKHKKYGPKMANPRISLSKRARLCTAQGYKQRAAKRDEDYNFTTRNNALLHGGFAPA